MGFQCISGLERRVERVRALRVEVLLGQVDQWHARSVAPDDRTVELPQTSLLVIRCWTASIHAWAGIFKLRPDWLDGRTLELFQADGAIRGRIADFLLATSTSRAISASTVALFELAIGPLLLWRRTRAIAVALAFAFHAGLELTARPDLVGWGMASLLLCFLEPAADERVGSR